MPYIKKEEREKYSETIEFLTEEFGKQLEFNGDRQIEAGEINYVFSSVLWKLFDKMPSYKTGNDIVGVLECIKQEFIRRKLNPYEDEKIEENGDI